jgi:hypothetical protein
MVGSRGSVVGWGAMLWGRRSGVWFPVTSLNFSVGLILPATLWPLGWVGLKQKWVSEIFLALKGGRCVRLSTSTPFMSRKCGRLDISQPCGPPQLLERVASSSSNMHVDHSHGCANIAVEFLDSFQILISSLCVCARVCVCYRSVVLFLNLNVIHLKF